MPAPASAPARGRAGRGRASLLPSLLGLLVGSLHAGVGAFRRLAVPKLVANAFSKTLGRIVNLGAGQPSDGRRGREWPSTDGGGAYITARSATATVTVSSASGTSESRT